MLPQKEGFGKSRLLWLLQLCQSTARRIQLTRLHHHRQCIFLRRQNRRHPARFVCERVHAAGTVFVNRLTDYGSRITDYRLRLTDYRPPTPAANQRRTNSTWKR